MIEERTTAYLVQCFRCLGEFNAMESAWCSCLSPSPSLVCPHCLSCFCSAPHHYKTGFWEWAPEELCKRRQELKHQRGHGGNGVPPPEEAPPRPFVLVVEDEEDLRYLAGELIHELGYSVLTASNGEQGLAMTQRFHPDLVLADVVLPRLGGREMCLKIKENPATRQIPVVIMSGIFTKEVHKTEAFRSFKANGYLRKPVSLKELGETCALFLSQDRTG